MLHLEPRGSLVRRGVPSRAAASAAASMITGWVRQAGTAGYHTMSNVYNNYAKLAFFNKMQFSFICLKFGIFNSTI